ncbi:hypothetical protein EYD45_14855 [Hyunsoonleella flava]|uniref:Uncharacterized protein n=1 Tax=Hyunsoonleella flava TaxID=2527939 RepID=A0A4Q9FGZ4_9FLAO|nr:hypothetical protein [Hyunsoonleella flava]TBN00216.1 hypothetical protein EYD45_14855 [Hyunsoonleella flava]
MKRITKLSLLSLGLLFFGCNIEKLEQSQTQSQVLSEKKTPEKNKDFDVSESDNSSSTDLEDNCYTTRLIAGQHYDIGTVTIDVEGDILTVTYTTNGDWVLNATHLHVSSCEEDGFPVTGANNPKIGHFDYASEHEESTTQVIYTIDIGEITGELCFAAHAEAGGPSEETAWAEGEGFGGNSWAMYFVADLTDCDDEDTPPTYG